MDVVAIYSFLRGKVKGLACLDNICFIKMVWFIKRKMVYNQMYYYGKTVNAQRGPVLIT